MRFDVVPELRLFGESVRAAIGGWEPSLEPELGAWQDDRDDELAARVAAVGWHELWRDEDGLAAAVAGGLELGRSLAPICLVDEATLGLPLAVGTRVRHGLEAGGCALALPGWGLARARLGSEREREATLDGSGTVTAGIEGVVELDETEAGARWEAWTAATVAYEAGMADAALARTVAYARSREQFGRPLARIPALQARLADAALAVDGLALVAWRRAAPGAEPREAALLWAGAACREVAATAHQVHGAIGFALESGVHRYTRRAKALQVWAAAVCRGAAD